LTSVRVPGQTGEPMSSPDEHDPGAGPGSLAPSQSGTTRPPATRYATSEDGVSIAYQTVGDGPLDLALELESWGSLDLLWELPEMVDLYERLSSFSRLILHDRRGTGLSGGRGGFPNLETRTRDLLTVLNTLRAGRVVLVGERTAGAAHAMLAATHPERVRALIWVQAVATRRWSPDYPWGVTPDELRHEIAWVRDGIGTTAFTREWVARNVPSRAGDEQLAAQIARIDRHHIPPSTAVDWLVTEGDTDVRPVLPLVRCPTLIIDHERLATGAEESRHVQSLIPNAELTLLPGDPRGLPFADRAEISLVIDRFATQEPVPDKRRTVLSTVLFTDIVGSTERQSSVGDRAWADLVARHNAVVRETLARWRGVENDTAGDGFFVTFDGPASAIRCALEVVDRLRQLGIEIRAGLHAGECEIVDGKRSGLAVTIGARIAAVAGPSEVLVSRTVKDLTAGSGFTFGDRGEHALKGLPESWQVFSVRA
jgi:class 3 adenylate cyclase